MKSCHFHPELRNLEDMEFSQNLSFDQYLPSLKLKLYQKIKHKQKSLLGLVISRNYFNFTKKKTILSFLFIILKLVKQ